MRHHHDAMPSISPLRFSARPTILRSRASLQAAERFSRQS
jgi:hypothetical protein